MFSAKKLLIALCGFLCKLCVSFFLLLLRINLILIVVLQSVLEKVSLDVFGDL